MTKVNLVPYKDRINQAKKRISHWNHDRSVDRPPFLFYPTGFIAPYTLGEQASDMDKAVESALQAINFQFENFPDTDYVPYFPLPYLGEGVIPSLFGAEQYIVKDTPPFTKGRVLKSIIDLDSLPKRIDPERDGWGPKVKEALDKFLHATHGEIPVGVTDHQSPYGIATKLLGNEELMLALYDEPERVRQFLNICLQATEDMITAMEKWAGDPNLIVKNYRAPVPDGGLIIWDDYISVITPSLHREFCVPANNALYKKYGKGHLHTCGPYFPGFIDTVVEHDIFTVDTAITRDMKRTEEDFLELKRLTKERGIKLYGALGLNSIHIHNQNEFRIPSRDFIESMIKDGQMFWVSGGTPEEGKEETQWINSLFT